MKVMEGLRIVQMYFPGASIGLNDPGLDAISKSLHELAMMNPSTRKEFIKALDKVCLGIQGNRVVAF